MVRKRILSLLTATLLLFTCGLGFAQSGNPSVQAIVAFANLLDPALLEQLRAQYGDDDALAAALLENLRASGVIDEQTASEMQTAMSTGVLPRNTFVVFLADVSNGTEPLPTREAGALELELSAVAPNVVIPAGDANGDLTDAEVGEIVTEVATGGGSTLDNIRTSYERATTPRNDIEGEG